MPFVTPQDVREYLSGFCGLQSTDDGVNDAWISSRITNSVLPFIQSVTGYTFENVQQFVEYKSGNGGSTLVLDHLPVIQLLNVELIGATFNDVYYNIQNFDLIQSQGIIKWRIGMDRTYLPTTNVFPRGTKNIKVTYTAGYGDMPNDMKEAVILMTAEKILAMIADQTGGGGSLSVQSWSRSWGELGMYTNIRRRLVAESLMIIRRYTTGVIG